MARIVDHPDFRPGDRVRVGSGKKVWIIKQLEVWVQADEVYAILVGECGYTNGSATVDRLTVLKS